MRRVNTFWTHLERLLLSVPEGADGVRSCRLKAIEGYFKTAGFPCPTDLISDRLANLEPSFAWRVTFDGSAYLFTRK